MRECVCERASEYLNNKEKAFFPKIKFSCYFHDPKCSLNQSPNSRIRVGVNSMNCIFHFLSLRPSIKKVYHSYSVTVLMVIFIEKNKAYCHLFFLSGWGAWQ